MNEKKENISKQQKLILYILFIVLILLFAISFFTISSQKAKYEKDLTSVVGVNFDMKIVDIVKYEKETYGNVDYEYSFENNRLDFALYGTEEDYRHMYFFDEDTGLLNSVIYRDIFLPFGNDGDAECPHVRTLKNKVIKNMGEWDKIDGDFYYVYGQIDGVKCHIRYEDTGYQKMFCITQETE